MKWFTKKQIGLEAFALEPGKTYVVRIKKCRPKYRKGIVRYLREIAKRNGFEIVMIKDKDFEFIKVPK